MKKNIVIISLFCCIGSIVAQVSNSDMVLVTGGSFTMGNASYARESPTRSVTVTNFYMSKYSITNVQFARFMNEYASLTVKDGIYAGKQLVVTDSWGVVNNNGVWTAAIGCEQFPAVKVTWYGANEFCKWYGGRLPTEAEWEFAAKGGINKNSYTFSGSNTATSVAWFYDNSSHSNKAVGTKTANSLGLYDMSGNVYQWCSDWFGRYGDFGTAGETNPAGPQTGMSKVIRGGYRSLGSADLHLTQRESLNPEGSLNFVGFRMVKEILTSVNNLSNDFGVRVFPNPVNDYIEFSNVQKVQKVEIVDVEGRVLYTSNSPTQKIVASSFPNGFYLLKMNIDSKESIRKIVVKH